MTEPVAAYWWNTRRNYGDLLTPLLLDRMADLPSVWAPIEEADWVVAGSVLDLIPKGWAGTVLGAGKLHEEFEPDLTNATVLALRGKLSARKLHHRGYFAIGDPGLLCSEFIPKPAHELYDLTVVPHWSDHELADRFAEYDPHVIDSATDTAQVVAEIAASKKVVASSLHGMIIADSYRVPRRAEQFPAMYHRYEGGKFKYDDYASALNEKMVWGEMHTPNEHHVERCQAELFDAFRAIAGPTPGHRRWR